MGYYSAFKLANELGVRHPLLSSSDDQQTDEITNQINNYKTRLTSVGQDVPAYKKALNLLGSALEIIDRPRNAAWLAIKDAVTNENGSGDILSNLGQGLSDGITGREHYSGTDLVDDLGGEGLQTAMNEDGATGTLARTARGIAGFGAEVVGDPLNALTFGTGSLAKGFLTGTGKSLTEKGAQALGKAALKDVTEESATKAAKELLLNAGVKADGEAFTKLLDQTVADILKQRATKALAKEGASLPEDMLRAGAEGGAELTDKTAGSIVNTARDLMTQAKLAADKAGNTGKGLSVFGKSLINDRELQDAGAAASNWLKSHTGVAGRAVDTIQKGVASVFSPQFAKGLSKDVAGGLYKLRRGALGEKNVADEALMKKFDKWGDTLGRLGAEDAKIQDNLIRKYLEGDKAVFDSLTEESKGIADEMKQMLEEMGASEKDAGVLFSTFEEGYFPHTPSWTNKDRARRGGITEKLKIDNPASFYRKYGGTVEKANRAMLYKSSSDEAKDAFTQAAYGLIGKDAPANPPSYNKIVDALQEAGVDEADLGKLTDQLDGVEDYFETSAVKAVMSRGLSHNKVIADKSFLDGITAAYGEKIGNQKALQIAEEAGKDIVVSKSSLRAYLLNTFGSVTLNKLMKQAGEGAVDFEVNLAGKTADKLAEKEAAATAEAAAKEAAGETVTGKFKELGDKAETVLKRLLEETPEAFSKVSPDDYQVLEHAGLFAKHNIIEAYAMPAGVIDAVNSTAKKQTAEGFRVMGDIVDRFYGLWKPTVTGLRVDYHVRNLAGSTFQNYLDIGFKTFDPRIQKDAVRVRSGVAGTVELAGQKIGMDEIRDGMLRTHANTNMQISEFVNQKDSLGRRIDQKMSGNIGGKVAYDLKHIPSTLAGAGEKVGRAVEGDVRTVNYLANVEKGLENGLTKEQALEWAGEQTNKMHFDYSELTDFEKSALRRFFPFYSWVRKNMPLQLEKFLNNPMPYAAIGKYQRNMTQSSGQDDANLPDWMKQSLALPTGQTDANGNDVYANVSLPAADINNLAKPGSTALGMLTPLIKTPVEAILNQNLLTGAPIEKYPGETTSVGGVDVNNQLMHILDQFGIARDVKNLIPNDTTSGDKTVSPLLPMTGLLRSYNEEKGQSDANYDYSRQLANIVQMLKDQGSYVPDTADAEKMATLSPAVRAVVEATGVMPPYAKKDFYEPASTKYARSSLVRKAKTDLKKSTSMQAQLEKSLKNILYKNGGMP